MSTLHQHPVTSSHVSRGAAATADAGTSTGPVRSELACKALAVLRVAFGLTFLWAFFDKLLGLGFSTGAITNAAGAKTGIDLFSKDAWINGGSPTTGFLKFGATGAFKGLYNGMAGQAWVNWAFMLGLLFIGLTLTFGIALRIGAVAGVVMYLMMWSVALLPTTNPVIDVHILGAVSMAVLGLTLAGDTWGLGRLWAKQPFVAAHPVLR